MLTMVVNEVVKVSLDVSGIADVTGGGGVLLGGGGGGVLETSG